MATYAGTVLAVVCLAVTATGALSSARILRARRPALRVLPPAPLLSTPRPHDACPADYFHKSAPVVRCDFVGTEGLQKEFGHDRVRARCRRSWGALPLLPPPLLRAVRCQCWYALYAVPPSRWPALA